ncbi:Neuronal-specific septin-3 [Zancudomyces culisetae]|uniref:Neuronal-specific septin-3 n=1 Tax=Zancudomyces culisetae TaxID=1213189 RepID=A0A1R1PSK9_ZANCU|nr:Neuronal-specific septin-3 [Zancudomyces culisetae]|eukprot:OMH83975.1 Neuronal-specific septin-3 [Zancudomyces culisetae]
MTLSGASERTISLREKIANAAIARHSLESINVMVVGSHSMGKSTLLQSLCNSFVHLEKIDTSNRRKRHSLDEFRSNILLERGKEGYDQENQDSSESRDAKTLLYKDKFQFDSKDKSENPFTLFDSNITTDKIYSHKFQVKLKDILGIHENSNKKLDIELIDTPGFKVDDMRDVKSKCTLIKNYIEKRYEDKLIDEFSLFRKPKDSKSFVHCIIYILTPVDLDIELSHRNNDLTAEALTGKTLTDCDRYMLANLSKVTNVIPVVGKLDILDKRVREFYSSRLFYFLLREQHPEIDIFDFYTNNIPEEILPEIAEYITVTKEEYERREMETSKISMASDEHKIEIDLFRAYFLLKVPFMVSGCEDVHLESYFREHGYTAVNNGPDHTRINFTYDPHTIEDESRENTNNGTVLINTAGFAKSNSAPAATTNKLPNSDFNLGVSRSIKSGEMSLSEAISSIKQAPHDDSSYSLNQNNVYSIYRGTNIPIKTRYGRSYPWGFMDVFNRSYCDFSLLLAVVFVYFRNAIIESSMDSFYEKYRTKYIIENLE